MIERTIREVLRGSVFIVILIPILALAAVADPSQFSEQAMRFSASTVVGGAPREELVSRIMVKPRYRIGDQLNNALQAHDASGLAKISNVAMSVVRPMSGGAHVVRLDHPVTLSEARVIAARLMRDSSVELAEPDRLKHPLAVTPTDPDYAAYQWSLYPTSSANLGSANLPNAWSITTGSNAVTVAVVDTGYRPHADLGSVVLPGYDFISDIPTANDGNGRDSDAQDPGDWITGTENTTVGGLFYGCGAVNSSNVPINQLSPSSWHGTHVSGIIAAQMNNGIGIAGVAPNIQILPVRVLGKCGGYDSDIIDGMRWAAGLAVTGVPTNPHPAQVLNMSLGGTGGAPCSSAYQGAVTDILNAGKVIVVAAGNDGTSTLSTPANCSGVIAVTANAVNGDNSWYATIGPGTTISAPGGGCGGMSYPNNCTSANSVGVYSLWNTGTTTPVSDGYVAYSGTSMATPHVSGVIALMLSLDPALTPTQIISYLQSSARPFPPGTLCTQTVNLNKCGAGLLDAYQALNAVKPLLSPPPAVTLNSISSTVSPGATVTLSGSAIAGAGLSIASYVWTQQSGPATVSISNANTANASFTAPSTAGSYSFVLTATDSSGQTGTATATIIVTPPVSIPPPAVTLSSTFLSVAPGDLVTLSGSAVAGTGLSITSYAWTQQSGPTTVAISNANTANANFTASVTGSYSFKLTVTDSSGQTGAASIAIAVNAPFSTFVSAPVLVPPPVVTLSGIPLVVAPGDAVTLSGSAVAGVGRSITSYAWTQQTGPTTVVISNANNANASFAAPPTGTYSFMLTAADNGGQTGTASAVIRVNSPPVLNTLPAQMVTVGRTLNFSVTASDVDGDTPIFHSVSLPSGATLSATGNFSWPTSIPVGSYTMTYYASDYYANSLQGTVNITVTAASSSGGGGGSLDAETLIVLMLFAAGLRLRRSYSNSQQ